MARLFNMPKSVSHLTTLLCPTAQVYLPLLKQNLFPKKVFYQISVCVELVCCFTKGFLPDFSVCWISMLLYKINNIFLFPYKMLLYKIINNIFLFHYKQYSWTEWLFIIKFEMEHCLSNALHRNGFSAITDVHLLNDYGRKTSPFPE